MCLPEVYTTLAEPFCIAVCCDRPERGVCSVRSSVSWGTDVAENVQLDPAKLADAIDKEERRQAGGVEADERKRGYNVRHEAAEVTEEEMEAYRLKKQRTDDPLQVPGGGSGTSGYDLV